MQWPLASSSIHIPSKILRAKLPALTAQDTETTVNLNVSDKAGKTTRSALLGMYYFFFSGMQLASALAFLSLPL